MNLKSTLGLIGCALLALSMPTPVDAQVSPRTCSSRVNPTQGRLTVEQAKMYFICGHEGTSPGMVQNTPMTSLLRDLNLQISPRSRRARTDDIKYNKGAYGKPLSMDTDKPVYDIRGNYTSYTCFQGRDCIVSSIKGTGICFLDTFGDWHCKMAGTLLNEQRRGPWPSAEGESNDRPTNAAIPEPGSTNEQNAALPENSAPTTNNYNECIQEIRGRFGYKQGQIITPFSPNFFNIVGLVATECER